MQTNASQCKLKESRGILNGSESKSILIRLDCRPSASFGGVSDNLITNRSGLAVIVIVIIYE